MSTLKIESNGIEMDWCCEHMDELIRKGSVFKLDRFQSGTGLYIRLSSPGTVPMVDKLNYCPYCGEKICITNDAWDTMLYKSSPARRPGHWEEL